MGLVPRARDVFGRHLLAGGSGPQERVRLLKEGRWEKKRSQGQCRWGSQRQRERERRKRRTSNRW